MEKIYIEVLKSKIKKVLPEIQTVGQVLGSEETFRLSNDGRYYIIEVNTEDLKPFDIMEAGRLLKWFYGKHKDGEENYCIHCYMRKYKRWQFNEDQLTNTGGNTNA